MAIGKIWLKEPHRQMSPRAPEGPSKFMNHAWFLPHGWIKSTRIWANYTSLERAQFSKQNIQITFFVWGPRGPDRVLWKFGPNREAPTIFLIFRLYSLHGHFKNLAERTPPANEPKGPWGPLEIHESRFLPNGWIKSTRIWANYTSLERAQFSKQNIQITFFVWGPRGPDRDLWKFGPNGEAPTIFLKFRLYSLHGHWKNLAERTPPANEPKGPWGPLEIHESWFLPHGWIKSTRIWANYTSLERAQFSKQNIQITFFVWGHRGLDRALWKFGPNGEAPTIFLKFRL